MENSEAETKVQELEGLAAQKDGELARANALIDQLKETNTSLGGEMEVLKKANSELEEKLTATGNSLKDAVASYRELLLKSSPAVVAEMVNGESIAQLSESLEKSRALVSRVRADLEAEVMARRVPAGAPVRRAPDLSHLSSREKISHAVSGQT
ncbi:MAG: hypothetical protein V1894_06005 [Chloroflexota bacterium]